MRRFLAVFAVAAASLLSACVFESATPLVPPGEYATPLVPGNYALMERKDDGKFVNDTESRLSLEGGRYTLTAPDGPMNFVLYRVSPNIYIAQMTEKPTENVYVLLEPTKEGAAITHLPCAQLNASERARFNLKSDTQSSCSFSNLDDLVTAALYLKGRGETPSMKLVRR